MQTATAQIFITAFQTLPKNEQLGVYHWMKDHKKELEALEKEINVKNVHKSKTQMIFYYSFQYKISLHILQSS